MKVRKGDIVEVLQGKDRSKKGAILQAFPKDERVIVEGVNIYKRHKKPKRRGEKGQIVEVNAPIPVSNVILVCPKCSKKPRVGYTIDASGKKERQCKQCKAMIA
jgi:large subunit ribosomal protein L24